MKDSSELIIKRHLTKFKDAFETKSNQNQQFYLNSNIMTNSYKIEWSIENIVGHRKTMICYLMISRFA